MMRWCLRFWLRLQAGLDLGLLAAQVMRAEYRLALYVTRLDLRSAELAGVNKAMETLTLRLNEARKEATKAGNLFVQEREAYNLRSRELVEVRAENAALKRALEEARENGEWLKKLD